MMIKIQSLLPKLTYLCTIDDMLQKMIKGALPRDRLLTLKAPELIWGHPSTLIDMDNCNIISNEFYLWRNNHLEWLTTKTSLNFYTIPEMLNTYIFPCLTHRVLIPANGPVCEYGCVISIDLNDKRVFFLIARAKDGSALSTRLGEIPNCRTQHRQIPVL
ncbi:hypothetical protein ElyMa_004522800 [Elysia marginata]|uniref:Uncharacterized protein n=1 Tax=Elysia marginata TaxID=1093978 RepID=A0AAV4HRM9_9GAST|nr:hypothetical protein ElyMa_004522800 [Elysia marginata]